MVSTLRQELLEKIQSFKYWHYSFDLGGDVLIETTYEHRAQKAKEIHDFVWPIVLEVCGGSLEGLRVLDIACDTGGSP